MAAPYVAGVAALVRAANPSLSRAGRRSAHQGRPATTPTAQRPQAAAPARPSGPAIRDGIAEPIVNA